MKLIPLFILFAFVGNAQLDLQPAYDFVNEKAKEQGAPFNLSEKMRFGSLYKVDTADLVKDSLFTPEDLIFIQEQLEYSEKGNWEPGKIKGVNVISEKEQHKAFRNHNKGWERFRKKYGNCLTRYSLPIFNVDHTYCIFFEWTQCDYLMGRGQAVVYKFSDGEWKLHDILMTGIS